MAHTQGEDVGVAGPRHVVLLDGLVERGLAEEQEAQANPHGQQPGHGDGTEPVAGGREGKTDREVCYDPSTTHKPSEVRGSVG